MHKSRQCATSDTLCCRTTHRRATFCCRTLAVEQFAVGQLCCGTTLLRDNSWVGALDALVAGQLAAGQLHRRTNYFRRVPATPDVSDCGPSALRRTPPHRPGRAEA